MRLLTGESGPRELPEMGRVSLDLGLPHKGRTLKDILCAAAPLEKPYLWFPEK